MNQFLHPVLQSLILKQFLARRSQNTNFNLIRRAGGTTSHVIVREDFDETVELGLSGGFEKVNQKFLRPRPHPGVESKPLQYRTRKDLGVGLGGKFGKGEGDVPQHLVPGPPGVPADDLGQGGCTVCRTLSQVS